MRVADYHRRFGLAPIPERALLYALSVARTGPLRLPSADPG